MVYRGFSLSFAAALCVTASSLMLQAGCGSGSSSSSPKEAPVRGVILISLDTLGAGHLGLYGYSRDTSPFLDHLAENAVVFEKEYVQLPGTLPSHMSIFTGLYPDQHNVFPPDAVLSPDIPTIPEVLQAAGFRTVGHTEGGFVSGRYGFARGFDVYDDHRIILWSRGNHVFKRGVSFLRSLHDDDRFFLFLHTYAVHDPYTPPPECRSLFWQDPVPEGAGLSRSQVLRSHNLGLELLSPEIVDYYRAMYDSEIRCLDNALEEFFLSVDSLGLRDDILIIVTADHGEEFLEHGKMAHEQIYNENLHVPLVILDPRNDAGRRVPNVVESIDLAPTIFDATGVAGPPGLPGHSLVPLILGQHSKHWVDEAFSRSIEGDRSLIARHDGSVSHLLHLAPDVTGDTEVAVARRLRFRSAPGRLTFELRGYREPTKVWVSANGHREEEFEARPDVWTAASVHLPDADGTYEVTFGSNSCQEIPSSADKAMVRCLSFHVRGLPLNRFELYDIEADPSESTDVSMSRRATVSDLASRMAAARGLAPVGQSEREALDPELQDQLRALGYID